MKLLILKKLSVKEMSPESLQVLLEKLADTLEILVFQKYGITES